MLIQGYEIPDKCPENCECYGETFSQSLPCARCPVFCCTPVTSPDGTGTYSMIEPDNYDKDRAKEWSEYFETLKS